MKKVILLLFVFSIKSIVGQVSFVPKTVLKFDPIQVVTSGELNISLEQKIARQFSVEADFGLLRFNQIIYPFSSTNDEDFSTNSEIGGFYSLGFRYYPLSFDEAPSGLYIEPQFKQRFYNFYYNDISYNGEVPQGSRKQAIASFNLGYQLWVADRFAFDFYGSFGIKFTDYTGFKNEANELGNTSIVPYTDSRSDLAVVLGIKFSAGISK